MFYFVAKFYSGVPVSQLVLDSYQTASLSRFGKPSDYGKRAQVRTNVRCFTPVSSLPNSRSAFQAEGAKDVALRCELMCDVLLRCEVLLRRPR